MKDPKKLLPAAVVLMVAAPTQFASADFSGQTILGPLTAGSSVNGNNTTSSNDNDGWFSGEPIFDIWNGGDDVYALNWLGGDLTITLTYGAPGDDPDLFLYTPGSPDESAFDDIGGDGLDQIFVANAAPGVYHILVDSVAGTEGAYQLAVAPVPGPSAVALLGLAAISRRRRRTV